MKNVPDIPRTAMEVFNLLPEGTLCEVVDNAIYMAPVATPYHQEILVELIFEIKQHLKKHNQGKALIAPCDVYLDGNETVVQPDILFIKSERLDIIQQKGIYGAPDLVIEILSTNKSYDQKQKFTLYERNQVPEYIIIDPTTKQVWQYELQAGEYSELEPANLSGTLCLRQLDLTIQF